MGFNFIFLFYFLNGLDFIKNYFEVCVEDLIYVFFDDSIDMILCVIGGDDIYCLLFYFFEND